MIQKEKNIFSPVSVLRGVGEKRALSFGKLGINNLYELIYHFPRAYEHRGNVKNIDEAEDGELCSLILCVAKAPKSVMIRRAMTLTKLTAVDDTGKCNITFFNQPYVKNVLVEGAYFRFFGRVKVKARSVEMSSPAFEPVIEKMPLRPLVPVYKLASPLSQKFMSESIKEALALSLAAGGIKDNLSGALREKYSLIPLSEALFSVHFPESVESAERARRRLGFDELYLFSLLVLLNGKKEKSPTEYTLSGGDTAKFLAHLPYTPTAAQTRSFAEIDADITSGKRMHRLLTGDVGSGKTLVALYALYRAVASGAQGAVMAPTEILAFQHYQDIAPFFAALGYSVACLTGSTRAAEKKKILSGLADGSIDIVIGTHALITDKVSFRALGLCVIDEEHRFGASQRAALSEKSRGTHMLSMSATPIPRTLAFVLYGDYDISVLDEKPAGRQSVDTFVVDESYRERLYAFIRKNVEDGGQVYIVCPAVEEREALESESGEKIYADELFTLEDTVREEKPKLFAAVDYAKKLSEEIFPDIPVGFVHGKLKVSDKEKAMNAFCAGEIKILVSTTVIEVGVNVPSATLMIVENADMFGLAALHQLRGRVGRGEKKSYCILVSSAKGESARTRLAALRDNGDGYRIAEIDLATRGPGDFIAERGGYIRQSGELRFALSGDTALLYAASDAARLTLERDPALTSEENRATREKIEYLYERAAL